MEYFRRCIGQADRGRVQSAIDDVLTKNGFSISNPSFYYSQAYKKYAINSCDFILYASISPCCVRKRGNFNEEEYDNNNFVMSGLNNQYWQGNTTLNVVFIPLKNDGYFINFSGLKKFDEFPNIAIKNIQ